jgi:polyisoprenoid-binding protein YceI
VSVRPSLTRWLVVILLVLGAVAAAGLWYVFFRPAGAVPVALSSPSPGSSVAVAGPTLGPGSSKSGTPASGIEGTWAIQPSASSFVGYRVQETLAGIGGNTAVGRTSSVSGTLTISGTTVTKVDITADLATLRSDDDRRDGQLRQRGLETGRYPTATFSVSQPIELGSMPEDGQTIDVTATGELTLHGVTKSVQIPLQARLSGGIIEVAGSLALQFADYRITAPTSFIALSVQDHGTMELHLYFARS